MASPLKRRTDTDRNVSSSGSASRNLSFFTTGDDVRIAYRIDGEQDRPALILANSIGTTLHMWDLQVPALTHHFRVVRYDLRGHGRSDVPPGAYSLDRMGRDGVELMDTIGIARAHFLGLSLGGFIGQWLGIHAGERIDRLILSNTSAYLGPAARWDEAIRNVLAAKDMRDTAETFLRNWFPQHMLENNDETVDVFRSMLLGTDQRGLAGAWALVRDSDLRRTISLIERPTLVIAGKHDTVTSLRDGELIAATIPNAELCVLPSVHLPNIEYPREFLDAVLRFLLGTQQDPIDQAE